MRWETEAEKSIVRINVRGLVTTLVVMIFAMSSAAWAQQAGKLWRIGYLGGSPSATRPFIEAFQQELARKESSSRS